MRVIYAVFLLAIVAATHRSASAQGPTIYDWVPTGTADWDDDANWNSLFGTFVPDAEAFAGDSARINNGGTATVGSAVPDVAGLNVANGGVEIGQGGVLNVIDDGVGNGAVATAAAGRILLSGNGNLTSDGDLTNAGTLQLSGPNVGLQVGGDFSTTGTLVAAITDANSHSTVNVTGNATLGGTLRVALSGPTPSFGQSWDLVDAAEISGAFGAIDSQASPALPRGLQYQVRQVGGTASLAVNNALVLTVDRQTGTGTIENVVGAPIEITGYAIRSDRGLLSVDDWMSATDSNAAGAGWREANPTANNLAELNLANTFSLAVGQSLSIGNPYSGGPSKPAEEDVRFEYTTPDGQFAHGIVEYTGAVNDFTLFVDPESGEAAIGNLSRFIETPVITSYAVRSDSSSLVVENWSSFTDSGEAGPGWRTANPTSEHLAELNLTNSMAFTNGTLISLGEIFATDGMQDLVLQYSTSGGELLVGHVAYGDIPVPVNGEIPGDYNGNGTVEQADLDLVLLNWGGPAASAPATWVNDLPMGQIDQDELDGVLLNWGNFAAAGMAAGSVPEPASICIVLIAIAILAGMPTIRDSIKIS